MKAKHCSKCSSYYEEYRTKCPVCGETLRLPEESVVEENVKRSYIKNHNENIGSFAQTEGKKNGIKKLPLILFAVVAIPFVVIWELVKDKGGRR